MAVTAHGMEMGIGVVIHLKIPLHHVLPGVELRCAALLHGPHLPAPIIAGFAMYARRFAISF